MRLAAALAVAVALLIAAAPAGAQELRTPYPVSYKRLEKIWKESILSRKS